MPTLNHLYTHIQTYKTRNSGLFIVSAMIFFFVIFDGIMAYISPIVMVNAGISEAWMGVIISTSSFAGIIFDFLICRMLRDTNYRRIFLAMFILAAFFPLILFQANTITFYIVAMAIWGFYYDFLSVGTLDFIGRTTTEDERASSFGVLRVFDGLGYLLAPILASSLIALNTIQALSPTLWLVLGISFTFFLLLLVVKKRENKTINQEVIIPKISALTEFHLWEKIGKILLPVLSVTLMLNIIDATFWTIGPLFSEYLTANEGAPRGLFMTMYLIPTLFIGWIVGRVTSRFGKKHTSQYSLLIASIFLTSIIFSNSSGFTLFISLCASIFLSLSWPSINGAYADYVSETPEYEKEIATLQDAANNLGYIIAPFFAGFAAEYIGYQATFASLGFIGIISAIILIKITPKSITVSVQ